MVSPVPYHHTLILIVFKPCSDGVWLGQTSSRSRSVLVDCGRWFEFQQSRLSYGAWFCKYLASARVNGCTDAVCPLPFQQLKCSFCSRKSFGASL
ncbi:hypothetical protein AVEN_181988-1 [Araneus ventricosus]|uniref:Uncharacterized protein n=1 Tax=Araneus ventricosus TaxID=182803 RepID=A0A4Y2JV73_ARAVE|nr:hypothetical protein AVEN_181988-1 [Araneus ventricosus]